MVDDIVTFGVDPEEDLVAHQESLQALYVKNISTLEGASIKEKWVAAELTKLKGQVKEAHSSKLRYQVSQEGEDEGLGEEQD